MMVNNIRGLVQRGLHELSNEYHLYDGEKDRYVGALIDCLEAGGLREVADDWARQQNEYVYTDKQWDMEVLFRHGNEWQEAERAAAKAVAARYAGIVPFGGPDGGRRVLNMCNQLLAETVAVFLADVYTTAVWDWLHLIRVESLVANEYLNDQAELAMAGVRDTPHFD